MPVFDVVREAGRVRVVRDDSGLVPEFWDGSAWDKEVFAPHASAVDLTEEEADVFSSFRAVLFFTKLSGFADIALVEADEAGAYMEGVMQGLSFRLPFSPIPNFYVWPDGQETMVREEKAQEIATAMSALPFPMRP